MILNAFSRFLEIGFDFFIKEILDIFYKHVIKTLNFDFDLNFIIEIKIIYHIILIKILNNFKIRFR